MKPKFRKDEEVYRVIGNRVVGEGIIESWEYVKKRPFRSTINGSFTYYTGYVYKVSGTKYRNIEEALRRKRQKYGSFDKMISEFNQPISKNILTEQ